ncbi:MAG TPA: TIR domain-containing protein [Acetobacteraceae bacterium]|nr:TIR domain-containing protein [Acetobacteraceae bacterium]
MPDPRTLIFLSHASQDWRTAETLCATIESRGFRCWIARRDIRPGENFQTAIVRAIRKSWIVLLVFTENTNRAEGIKKELALASQNKLPVIPLRMEEIMPDDALAFELVTRQWFNMFEDWENAVNQLLTRLSILEPPESTQAGEDVGGETGDPTPDAFVGGAASTPAMARVLDASTVTLGAENREEAGAADFPQPHPAPHPASASPQGPPTPTTARPMVVVLPFESIGGDPEQTYFANGLSADLVTDLARFRDLHIVSPQLRGLGPGIAAPGPPGWTMPAAAAYVCSGSVRRAGGRIRITVQLADARTGVTLWAERFDRPLDDLFSVQEELAERLPAYLASRLTREGTLRAQRRPPANLDAYDLCLRGRDLIMHATEADTLAARELFSRAIERDPRYAAAYAWKAYTVHRGFTHLWGQPRGRPAAVLALELARRSVELEPESSVCLARLAYVLLLNEGWDEALDIGRAAVLANPYAAEVRASYANVLVYAGQPVDAAREVRLAVSLDPFSSPSRRALLGQALLLSGQPEEALSELRWCAARLSDYGPCYRALAVAAIETGRTEEAGGAVQALLRISPSLTMRNMRETMFFRDPAVTERFLAGMRAAGMPNE